MDEVKVYSEKLGKLISISNEISTEDVEVKMEDCNDSLVGWTHGGWNNDNGTVW